MITLSNMLLKTATAGVVVVALMACTSQKEDVQPDPVSTTGSTEDLPIQIVNTPPLADSKPPIPGALDPSSSEGIKPDAGTTDYTCPTNVRGGAMVQIAVPGGKPFCIDANVTTYGEYRKFVEEKGNNFEGQPAMCEKNKDYRPTSIIHMEEQCGGCLPVVCGPELEEADPNRAVECLDFCDAWAYCAWANKRLCGIIGAVPGKVNSTDLGDIVESINYAGELAVTPKSEWFNVCSQGGSTKYPYGNVEEPGRCIDDTKLEAEGDAALAVTDTSQSECRGTHPPYDSVFNMSGSAPQWLNICSFNSCIKQGGRYINQELSCEETIGSQYFLATTAGIRGCADAVPSVGAMP